MKESDLRFSFSVNSFFYYSLDVIERKQCWFCFYRWQGGCDGTFPPTVWDVCLCQHCEDPSGGHELLVDSRWGEHCSFMYSRCSEHGPVPQRPAAASVHSFPQPGCQLLRWTHPLIKFSTEAMGQMHHGPLIWCNKDKTFKDALRTDGLRKLKC